MARVKLFAPLPSKRARTTRVKSAAALSTHSPEPRAFNSKWQRPPADILLIIFEFVVAADFQLPDFNARDMVQAHKDIRAIPSLFSRRASPRNLSQVCQSWRTVARGHGRLWTSISLYETNAIFDKEGVEVAVSKLEDGLALSRGTTRPLTLSSAVGISSLTPQGGFNDWSLATAFHRFVEIASRERARWERVSFVSFISPIDKSSVRFSDYPLLKELCVRFPAHWPDLPGYNGPIVVDFTSCALLETLKLDGDFFLDSDGTQLQKLKHVEIFRHDKARHTVEGLPSPYHAIELAYLAPNVTTLILDVYPWIPNPDEPETRPTDYVEGKALHLPHLTKLCIRTADKHEGVLSQIPLFLDKLIVPGLKELELELAEELDVLMLIERSGCRITSLSVDGTRRCFPYEATDEDIRQDELLDYWLTDMPELQSLSMTRVDITEYLVYRLTLYGINKNSSEEDEEYDERECDLCLSLKSLAFHECEPFQYPDFIHDVVLLLRSRLGASEKSFGKMERFCAIECELMEVLEYLGVQKWIKRGSDIQIADF